MCIVCYAAPLLVCLQFPFPIFRSCCVLPNTNRQNWIHYRQIRQKPLDSGGWDTVLLLLYIFRTLGHSSMQWATSPTLLPHSQSLEKGRREALPKVDWSLARIIKPGFSIVTRERQKSSRVGAQIGYFKSILHVSSLIPHPAMWSVGESWILNETPTRRER